MLVVVAAAAAAWSPLPRLEAQAPAASDRPTFATGTAKVVLDVVVRDKKGRPVLDVRADEIEVLEEGQRQTIEGFERIETQPPVAPQGAPAPAEPDSTRQLSLVTLVFDQLGETGRRQAQRAAEAFLERGLRANTYAAVFRVDQRLSMVQAFTTDRAKLKDAVARSTSGTNVGVTDEKAALEQVMAELQRTAGLESATGPGAASQGAGFAARAQAQALSNMLRMANELQRQQMGTTSLYPLMALVKGQQTLAGRKTLLYLTERLDVPPNLEAVYRSVISEANRANVSVYTIDARGLSTEQEMAGARDALLEAQRVSQQSMESLGAGAVSKDEVKLSETAESSLRASVEGVLRDLAESTGGFAIANTNNFKPGAERIATDIAGYYQLSYVPPPSPFDGRFRRIEVRVNRKDVVVQARSGYFALPPGVSQAVFPYEVPLLGALSIENPPKDFEVRAAALRFGASPAGLDHKIVVEVPIAALKMMTTEPVPPEKVGRYRLHLSLVALVKSEAGDVVERFSEDYPFEGPADKADALARGQHRLQAPPRAAPREVPAGGRGPGPRDRQARDAPRALRGEERGPGADDQQPRAHPPHRPAPGGREVRRPARHRPGAHRAQPRRPDLARHQPEAVAVLHRLPGPRRRRAAAHDARVPEGRQAAEPRRSRAARARRGRQRPLHRQLPDERLRARQLRRPDRRDAGGRDGRGPRRLYAGALESAL